MVVLSSTTVVIIHITFSASVCQNGDVLITLRQSTVANDNIMRVCGGDIFADASQRLFSADKLRKEEKPKTL